MECRGKFSHKTLRKAQFAGLHFDDLLNFRSVEKDRLSGKVFYFLVPTSLSQKLIWETNMRLPSGCSARLKFHKAHSWPQDTVDGERERYGWKWNEGIGPIRRSSGQVPESQPRKTMYTYRGIETPIYHTSQVFMKCHTRYPGMNVAISRRGLNGEFARARWTGIRKWNYIPTSNKVSCSNAVIGQA